MPENPFAGASKDPTALLEQLITRVGGLQRDMDQFRQELRSDIAGVRQELRSDTAEVRQELHAVRLDLKADIAEVRHEVKVELSEVRQEVRSMRDETFRFLKAADKEQDLLREHVETALERKSFLARTEWKSVYSELERRVAELEAAERRRETAGA